MAAALAAVGLAAAPAAADRATVADPAGDAVAPGVGELGAFDIVAAGHGHARGGRVRHVIRLAGAASVGDPHRPGTGARIEISTDRGRPGDCNGNARDPLGRAEYVVTTESDGGILDCTTGGVPELHPAASVRVRGDRIVLSLPARAIGSPRRYAWLASTGTGATTTDLAPQGGAASRPRYRPHALGAHGPRGGRVRGGGDLQRSGAGAYDIRARRVGCGAARRVARRFRDSGGDKRLGAWRCRYRETGIEALHVRCVRRSGGSRRPVVTFGFGA